MALKTPLSVGYPVLEQNEGFLDVVRDYRERIGEVYFAWVGAPSGRAAAGRQRGYADWGAQEALETDLRGLRDRGLKLDLLYNANCHGGRSLSLALANEVRSVVHRIADIAGEPDAVTTASLAVAYVVHNEFPDVDVRASVNMRLGRPEAMRHVAGLFDSFHLQRDLQRDAAHAAAVGAWCRENGKGLGMLANSGCLRFCPGQTFHDNLVAHDAEIAETENLPDWNPHVCWNAYRDRAHRPAFLQSTWIRPEDLHRCEGHFDVVKLATRMHSHPRMVIHAYASGAFRGNLADLMEPCFSPAFAPYIVDNERFPADWFERTSACAGNCVSCGYCAEVSEKVFVRVK